MAELADENSQKPPARIQGSFRSLRAKIKKPGVMPGFKDSAVIERSGRFLDVRRLFALGSLDDLEADLLAFLERLETIHLYRREMCKQILAAFIGRDESIAFRVVEPFDRTS
jgi:hypothetical protein